MKKFIYKKMLYVIFFGILCIIIGNIFFYNKNDDDVVKAKDFGNGWIYLDGKEEKNITLPTKVDTNNSKTAIIKKIEIPKDKEKKDELYSKVLFIRSHHQFVKIYINDELIDKNEGCLVDKSIGLKSGGNFWTVLNLNRCGQYEKTTVTKESKNKKKTKKNVSKEKGSVTLKIEYESVYDRNKGEINEILIGTKTECMSYITSKSLLSIVLSGILFGISIFMVLLWKKFNKRSYSNGLLELAVCTGNVAIWAVTTENILGIIVPYSEAIAMVTHFALMFSILPMLLYSDEKFKKKESRLYFKILLNLNVIIYVVIFLLNVLKIKDFSETITIIHIDIVVVLISNLISELKSVFDKKLKLKMSFLGFAILVVLSFGIDIIRYYIQDTKKVMFDVAFCSRFGIILFILFIGIKIVHDMLEKVKLVNKKNVWNDLAYKDILTNVGSRLGYLEKMESLENNRHRVTIFSIDLNNLKQINDKYGHSEGDGYIKDCVKILKEIFSEDGACFRTGGDEFVIIIDKLDEKKYENYIKRLNYVNENSWVNNRKISFAYGKATYDEEKDKNLYETLARADKEMYVHKKKIKAIIKEKWER